jgi:D-glycero-D-manno-heptose 1,7-bisphosphate phosphatase
MTTAGRPAVFLDRDGVLNRPIVRDGKPYPPASLDEVEFLPGVREAVQALSEAGYLLICITNQPDVSRGTQRREVVEAINAAVQAALPLDEIIVCYDTADESPRRKPNPGMILEAAQRRNIDLSRSFVVGDRWKDMEAGRRAGCRTILIDYGYREPWRVAPPEHRAASLAEATARILEHEWKPDKREPL